MAETIVIKTEKSAKLTPSCIYKRQCLMIKFAYVLSCVTVSSSRNVCLDTVTYVYILINISKGVHWYLEINIYLKDRRFRKCKLG